MRIALISPSWGEMINSYPPLGLAFLAAVLEKNGHKVKIFDFGLEPNLPVEKQTQRVLIFQPELIGITSLTNTYYSANQLAKSIKKNNKDTPIVMGGPHPTIFPQETLKNSGVDLVVFGEGEDTLLELVETLQNQKGLKKIRGLAFKREKDIIVNQPRPLIDDLDALPFPARHLLALKKYPLRDEKGNLMVTIMSSRGCPYGCTYCFKEVFGRRCRKRSAENVVNELEAVKNQFGISSFYFIDDLFTFDKKRVLQIAKLIQRKKLDITWQCLSRVDHVNLQMLKKMRQAGCKRIHFGIESGNEEILKKINKQITIEQVKNAIKWCKEIGIYSKGYFMIGLPGDNKKTIKQTIDFSLQLSNLGLNDAMFSLTTPFPGSELWNYVPQKKKVKFDTAFSKAYYLANNPRHLRILHNLSRVSDSQLIRGVEEANYKFSENKLKERLVSRFGKVGVSMWFVLKFKPLRQVVWSIRKYLKARSSWKEERLVNV